jgi:2-dehydro-3-deoxyphosphogluconate aldolase/(4S)-4-hydroxy-2-oxoglutarate aldolase
MTMNAKHQALDEILRASPVVPVVVLDDADAAVPLARALVAGGIRVIEVTLRTPAAIDAIGRIAREVPDALVGAGTVLDGDQLAKSRAAGAAFAVSPGYAPRLLDAADASPLPLLPGASTAAEAMSLAERGYRLLKFFPAEPAGGPAYLKALASPLPMLRFCPTGGIDRASAPRYLALGNVVCVGGSWLTPADRIAAGDWAAIEALARDAAGLGAR